MGDQKRQSFDILAFSDFLKEMDKKIGMKMSARGWAYALEDTDIPQIGTITKGDFDYIENLINKCRKEGYLPVDFVAQEEARAFSGVETPTTKHPVLYLKTFLNATLNSAEYYTPDWWDGEEYYIQMVVEKIDLKSLFEPICRKFHIPIATAKGWSSIIQRAEYAKRFKKAEEMRLKCVLLYCGDHDPDGLRISHHLRNNLAELSEVYWNDGTEGYNPENLIIDRFGLNYDFIINNKLTWIENLITGSKRNLASPSHKNYNMPYVQDYLRDVGERKCEANALVKRKVEGRRLCEDSIVKYLGKDAEDRFEVKRQEIRDIINDFFAKTKVDKTLQNALDKIDGEFKEEEDDEND